MDRFKILRHSLTGSLSLAAAKLEEKQNSVTSFLRKFSGKLSFELWDEQDVDDANKTHFSINVSSQTTPGFCIEKLLRYGDVAIGYKGFKMMVHLNVEPSAGTEPSFLPFKNKDRYSRIQGVTDSDKEVAYRTEPRWWIDAIAMLQ